LEQFGNGELRILEKATSIAEELTSEYFSMTHRDWAKYPFYVETITASPAVDCPEEAFAHLIYYGKERQKKASPRDRMGCYKIYVNDPKIMDWIRKRPGFRLLPFLTYVMTHELVHIARFIKFYCHPVAGQREKEEEVVHGLTHVILKSVKMDGLSNILEYFKKDARRFNHANL